MLKSTRSTVVFVAACACLFVLLCIATAQLMVQLIVWYLNTCPAAGAPCSPAEWLISYWWLAFVPFALLLALAAWRIYFRLFPEITDQVLVKESR